MEPINLGRENKKQEPESSWVSEAACLLELAPAIRKGYFTSDADCQACQADVNSSENSDFCISVLHTYTSTYKYNDKLC